MGRTSEEPTNHEEEPKGEHFSKTLRTLLVKRPELIDWREGILTEQIHDSSSGNEGISYREFNDAARKAKYFQELPHSLLGWMIRACSPDNLLLRIQEGIPEKEHRKDIIIDPFRVASFFQRLGFASLEKIPSKETLRAATCAVRDWLLTAKPLISGRIIIGGDGHVARFQEVTQKHVGRRDKLLPILRAQVHLHHGIYETINSQHYAQVKLGEDSETTQSIIEKYSGELLSLCSHQIVKRQEDSARVNQIVDKILDDLQPGTPFFYLYKMVIDYLLRLGGDQHDNVRIYWAMQSLQDGLQNRMKKNANISEQVILLNQKKDIELYHWKNCILGSQEKVDIEEVIATVVSDYPNFRKRISRYNPAKNVPIFNPFFSFYRDWSSHLARQESDGSPHEAQLMVAKQFIIITLQEIKTRYAYCDSISLGKRISLEKRIATVEKLRKRFFSEKPEIAIDFSAEKNTINEALKKEIARYK